MTADYVALLRGINVGGHRVKMDRLRALFAETGFEEVETFIASGNVIFSAEPTDEHTLATRIREHLAEALGYDVPTFIRTPEELERVAGFEPPIPTDAGRESWALYVVFLERPADEPMRARLAEVESASDRFHFAEREVYWSIRGKLSESPLFGAGLERALGDVSSTARNLTSVRKLVAKVRGRSDRLGR